MKQYKAIRFLGPKDKAIASYDKRMGFDLYHDNYTFFVSLSKRMIGTWHQEQYWRKLLYE